MILRILTFKMLRKKLHDEDISLEKIFKKECVKKKKLVIHQLL